MSKDLDSIIKNIRKDLKDANSKDIDLIYSSLLQLLKKYDNDTFFKNIGDFFKKIFKTKREKCCLFFEDIVEGINDMDDEKKRKIKKDLLDLSNIHRTFLENLKSLIEAL